MMRSWQSQSSVDFIIVTSGLWHDVEPDGLWRTTGSMRRYYRSHDRQPSADYLGGMVQKIDSGQHKFWKPGLSSGLTSDCGRMGL
jgi:hypothetical protein